MMIRMAVENDPYEFLFGWSNSRLGRLNSMLESMRLRSKDQSQRSSKEPIRDLEGGPSHDQPKAAAGNDATNKGFHSGSKAPQGNPTSETIGDKRPDVGAIAESFRSFRQQDRLIGACWTRSSINSSGERRQSSGKLEYDPITMRMTSKESFSPEKVPKEQSSAQTVESVADNANSGKTFASRNTTQISELPKARRVPINVNDTTGSDRIEVNQFKKKELEQSWARVKAPKRSADHTTRQSPTTPSHDEEDAGAMKSPQRSSEKPIASEQHQPKDPRITKERGLMIDSMFKKRVPLKHMDAHDFHNHRIALLRNWSKIRREPPTATKADQKLSEEVRSQKAVMDAIESRRIQKCDSDQQNVITPAQSMSASTKTAAPVEAIAGEGDVSHNVAEFSKNDKWYKKPAPHASAVEEQKQRDRELVQAVREIYEDAYGPIKPGHRQGRIISTNEKAAKASALLHDLGDADHTRFAEFIKSNLGSSTVPKKVDGQGLPNNGQETESRTKTDVSKTPQVRVIDNIWNLRIYELSGEPSEEGESALQHMSSLLGPALSIKDLCHTPKIPLIKALSELNEPGRFIERLVKEGGKDQDVVFAKNNVLVLRNPSRTSLESKQSSSQQGGRKQGGVPIDEPKKDPKKGFVVPPRVEASAEKAGFVDDFKPASKSTSPMNGSRMKNNRRVHKQEDVFSGVFPKQKFTVPEIIEILNDRGLLEGQNPQSAAILRSEASPNNSGKATRPSKEESNENTKNSQQRGRSRPSFIWVFTIAGTTATCCYSLGAVVENLRELEYHRAHSRRRT
ncbi:MAG: hypothetical protein M1831_004884 [Alyxoria varia]|nr:MAG: hypothetical protein M1831_004884 [Alyxoria varia]